MPDSSTKLQIKEWDFLVDKKPLKGSWNMAVDEFLFRSLGEKPKTYLRFYMWKKATVSLGYSQKIQNVLDVDYCRKKGIDIVRRMTGGKLVLHHKEVTYSVSSSDYEIFTSTLADSYRRISEALMRGLEMMSLYPVLAEEPPSLYARGNLPCFSYPARNEVEVEGKKIIGSAQKRVGSRFIQHGSIPLEDDEELLKSVSFLKGASENMRMGSLSQALGMEVSFEWAVNHLSSGFAEYFGIILRPRRLSREEKKAISLIQKEKYGKPHWTFKKKS